MTPTYYLRQALTLNATATMYDAVAAPVDAADIKRHSAQFDFDFVRLAKTNTVYKLHLPDQPDIIQALVALRPDAGFMECANMETAAFNKSGRPLYSGAGRAIVALCCKISFEEGFDGYIRFEAKSRLFPYYERLGAKRIGGLLMIMDEAAALKLTARYF